MSYVRIAKVREKERMSINSFGKKNGIFNKMDLNRDGVNLLKMKMKISNKNKESLKIAYLIISFKDKAGEKS